MTQEQFQKAIVLNNRLDVCNRVLSEIRDHKSQYRLAFGEGNLNKFSVSWMANEGIEKILDKHHQAIVEEVQQEINDIRSQINNL